MGQVEWQTANDRSAVDQVDQVDHRKLRCPFCWCTIYDQPSPSDGDLQKTAELAQENGRVPQKNRIVEYEGKTGARKYYKTLTGRQLEVLQCVARGLTNRQIAAELIIAEATVQNHLRDIFERLNVLNRAEAVDFAHRLNLL